MKINDVITKPEVIKLAAEAYAVAGGSPEELILETVEWLTDCYGKTGDHLCWEAASQTAKAYSEMERSLKPTYSQVGEALGRWPGSAKKEESFKWVLEDILYRVCQGVRGCSFYRKGQNGGIFELLVLEDSAWLMDMEKKRMYRFEQMPSSGHK